MFNFNGNLEPVFKMVAQNACDMGVDAYFVGGMVRDILMGIEIKDIDILVEGSAIDFVQKLSECAPNVIIKSVHKAFNTAKTVINGLEIDFASTREEIYPQSGCLPVIQKTGCPVGCDLKRRDFTVNAIAVRFFTGKNELKYELIDPFNGSDDIKARSLKVLHNKSYIDDPTRILRGLDFKLRFGFNFSENDKKLIEEHLKSPDREGLSIDRIKLTLKKLFSDKNAKKAYNQILENNFYKIWCDIPSFKHEWAQRLDEASSIFNVLKKEIFLKAIFENELYSDFLIQNHTENFEIYNQYKNLKPLDLALRYAIFNDGNVIFYFQKLKDIKLDISGDDLIQQGFSQGKALGDELSRLLKEKLNSIERN